MSYTFDSEDILDATEEILRTKLNAKILQIEAEKNARGKSLDSPLGTIDDDAFVRQSWNEGFLNKSPTVRYGLISDSTTPNGYDVAETFKVFIEANFIDHGLLQNNDGSRRIARYARAIKEVFREAGGFKENGSRFTIESVGPASILNESNTSEELKVSGIILTVSLY